MMPHLRSLPTTSSKTVTLNGLPWSGKRKKDARSWPKKRLKKKKTTKRKKAVTMKGRKVIQKVTTRATREGKTRRVIKMGRRMIIRTRKRKRSDEMYA